MKRSVKRIRKSSMLPAAEPGERTDRSADHARRDRGGDPDEERHAAAPKDAGEQVTPDGGQCRTRTGRWGVRTGGAECLVLTVGGYPGGQITAGVMIPSDHQRDAWRRGGAGTVARPAVRAIAACCLDHELVDGRNDD